MAGTRTAAAELNSALQTVLRHLPWEDVQRARLAISSAPSARLPGPGRPAAEASVACDPRAIQLVAAYELRAPRCA